MIPTVKERQAGAYDFRKYYENLCALRNFSPISAITSHVDNGVLDISADRIKTQEWDPVFDAIKINKSLHFIAVRSFYQYNGVSDTVTSTNRRRPPILLSSSKLLLNLCKSLRQCACVTEKLTFLELQNLPLSRTGLLQICEGIRKNHTLKHLSFEGSSINDDGLEEICRVLRHVPNISTLNLTSCNLSKDGISSLTVLINYQAMQRHNAAWQESLRYRFPELDRLGGLKRITLNDNPKICDEGSTQLADALIDDLWVKAIDLQACNLSDSSASTWLAVLIGLRIPNGNQSMTHDEIHLKSNRSSTIDDQHRGNHSLVVLDLRRNPNISRDLLRAVTERALINSEGKQTEFSWLKAGSQTPSQLCSGVTTYPWPGLTNMSNHIPGIDLINPYNRSVKSSNSYRTRSRSNNSLYNHEKIIHSDDKNVCIYHKNNLSDRPPFIPAGGRPRCRSADPAHYLDHRTHHKCNVDLHRKHNRHLHCSDSGQPLSERAVWKPPGVAKTIQKAYYSRPTTPLSSRTSFSGGIPWRTAARASRSRGYPSFQCPGKTCLESRALHLDYNLVNKQSSNVNNINQNNNKSVILPYAKTLNRVVADGCHCQHHHQPQTQQQRLGHNRQKSCSKINSRISSPELSGMNFQHKLKHLMTKVSQLEKDLQTEKRKSDRLLKNRQFVQQVNKSKHLLKIDQDSIYQLRNFICRLTNMIETLQNSKNKSNASNEELTVLQDTFEELCSLISRITEEENDFDEGEKQIQDILENVNKKHSSTYCNEISSIKKNKQINKIEKCMNHTKQSFKHKPIVNNHEKCNTKQVKGHIQWKTIAKTRAVQTESPQSPQKNDEKLMDNRKFIQHKYEVSNPHIEWIPSTCTNTTTHTNIKGTMSNSYHDNDNNNIINNTKVIPLHSEDEQEQSQITSNTSINSNNNNLWIKNHETINHKNGIDDHNSNLEHQYCRLDKNTADHHHHHHPHHHSSMNSTEQLIDNLEIFKKSSQIDQMFAELKAATIIDNKPMNRCIPKVKSIEICDKNEVSILNDSNSSPSISNVSNIQNINSNKNSNTIEDNDELIDKQVDNTNQKTTTKKPLTNQKSNEFNHPLNIETNHLNKCSLNKSNQFLHNESVYLIENTICNDEKTIQTNNNDNHNINTTDNNNSNISSDNNSNHDKSNDNSVNNSDDELFNELIRDNIDSPISNPTDYDVNSVDYDDDDDQLSSTSTSLLLDNSNPIYQSTNNSLISTEN